MILCQSILKSKIVNVSMNRVAIPNLYIKVWICKIEFTQRNVLRSLTQPKITIQRLFDIIY